jgi:hypothetical protein
MALPFQQISLIDLCNQNRLMLYFGLRFFGQKLTNWQVGNFDQSTDQNDHSMTNDVFDDMITKPVSKSDMFVELLQTKSTFNYSSNDPLIKTNFSFK